MMKNSVTVWKPAQILDISVGMAGSMYTIIALIILGLGCVVQFIVSYEQEKNVDVQGAIDKKAKLVKWAVNVMLLVAIAILGMQPNSSGGFIYAQF